MRRVVLILLLLVAAAGGYLYFRGVQESAEQASGQRLQTALVETADLQVTVRATGTVQPAASAQLSFDAAGIVEEILVDEGQFVQAGDILARLDGELQRIGVEQAEWSLRIAELNLAQLEAPPDQRDINAAQASVNSAWAAYVELRDNSVSAEAIRAAELRYEQAVAAWDAAEQASRDARRTEDSLAQVGAASFSAEMARLQLEQVRAGPGQEALNAAQAQVAQAQAQLRLVEAGPAQAQLDQATIAAEQAQLQLARAQEAYESTVLRAPFAGVVHRVNVQESGLASSGLRAAVELYDLSHLSVTIDVDEIDVVQVTVGQPVELTLDALPGQVYSGVVSRVAEVSSQSSGVVVYAVDIDFEADSRVRAGMTTAATVVVREVRDVLVVPNTFIRLDRRTDQAYVNVLLANGQLEERAVGLGAQNETASEVRAGLQAGDVVAVDLDASGFSFFMDGE